MEKVLEKECLSCGEKGHTYNECKKVPFLGLFAGSIGIPTKPICGLNENEIINNINKIK